MIIAGKIEINNVRKVFSIPASRNLFAICIAFIVNLAAPANGSGGESMFETMSSSLLFQKLKTSLMCSV